MRVEVINMPKLPHEMYNEKPPHEEILERLGRIEDILRRLENKFG